MPRLAERQSDRAHEVVQSRQDIVSDAIEEEELPGIRVIHVELVEPETQQEDVGSCANKQHLGHRTGNNLKTSEIPIVKAPGGHGGVGIETSMALLLKALSMSKEEVQTAEEGRDVFKQGTSVRETSFPRGQGLGIRAVVASLPTRRLQSSWLATRRANAVGISSTGESSVTW